MKSNIIFFDCTPSLIDEQIPEYFPENIRDLENLIKSIKVLRPSVQINLDTSIFDLKISENCSFRSIPNEIKHQVKEEITAIKIQLQKSPYSVDSEHKLDHFLGIEAKYKDEAYDSLTWAYLLDSLVLSFNKKILDWESNTVEANISDINNEDDKNTLVSLRHASNQEHINFYQTWLSTFEEIPEIEDFISDPSKFLSQIILLDEAKDNLRALRNHFPTIYETLNKANLDLIKWENQSSPIQFSIKNAPFEHEGRKRILSKLGYKGYEAHLFFTGNIAGRIHYKLVGNKIEIKYIGKKLGI